MVKACGTQRSLYVIIFEHVVWGVARSGTETQTLTQVKHSSMTAYSVLLLPMLYICLDAALDYEAFARA